MLLNCLSWYLHFTSSAVVTVAAFLGLLPLLLHTVASAAAAVAAVAAVTCCLRRCAHADAVAMAVHVAEM